MDKYELKQCMYKTIQKKWLSYTGCIYKVSVDMFMKNKQQMCYVCLCE